MFECVYVHACVCVFMSVCVCVCVCVCVYMCTYIHIKLTYRHMIRMYICKTAMHPCMFTYMYACIYIIIM